MDISEIISLALGIIGIIGIIFTIYFKFANPQVALEKEQIKTEEDIKDRATILSQKEVETKAGLLAQQVQWEKESNEKKFTELLTRMDNAMTLAQNHTHSVDLKVDGLMKVVSDMDSRFGKELVRLSTIIEERFPCKK
jgi:hypothetical protein